MRVDIIEIRIEVCPVYRVGPKGEEGQFHLGKWLEDNFLNGNLKGTFLVVKWREDGKIVLGRGVEWEKLQMLKQLDMF